MATAEEAMVNKPAPPWELTDVFGRKVKLSDFHGRVVVLDFWATWCGPCRKEIPDFIDLQQRLGTQGLTIIGASVDEGGVAVVKPFVQKNKMNYPVVLGADKITGDYGGIEGIPTTFIIDRRGKIVAKHVGLTEKADFEKEIMALLKTAS